MSTMDNTTPPRIHDPALYPESDISTDEAFNQGFYAGQQSVRINGLRIGPADPDALGSITWQSLDTMRAAARVTASWVPSPEGTIGAEAERLFAHDAPVSDDTCQWPHWAYHISGELFCACGGRIAVSVETGQWVHVSSELRDDTGPLPTDDPELVAQRERIAAQREEYIGLGLLPNPNECSAAEWSPVPADLSPMVEIYERVIEGIGLRLGNARQAAEVARSQRRLLDAQLRLAERALDILRARYDLTQLDREMVNHILRTV